MSIVQGGPRRPPAVPEVVPLADRLAGVRDQPVSFLLLVTAVWLAVAPWALHYPADGTRGAHLVETCTAVFLAIVALALFVAGAVGGERGLQAFLVAVQVAMTGVNFALWALLPGVIAAGEADRRERPGSCLLLEDTGNIALSVALVARRRRPGRAGSIRAPRRDRKKCLRLSGDCGRARIAGVRARSSRSESGPPGSL